MKVPNRKCIRHLAWKSLKASRTRNLIAVAAVALTAVLFTSLFTIALSINEGVQQSNFRQVGGFSHGGFKYITEEQDEKLRDDPLIGQWGERRFLGMPTDVPFNKSHVEVSWCDANEAHWMYCDPVEGALPAEGTDQAATDTRVLELLGIQPEIGAKFTLTFDVDGHPTTQTFTLSGWWEYDEAIVANHVLLPESRVDAILSEAGVNPNDPDDGMTGTWNLDVMLKSGARHIEQDINRILENHGYQSEAADEDFIHTGVNWGYTGSRVLSIADPTVAIAIAAVILLIIFTGYLIIYNVFQISVAGDIRFYGLLKTIGTTPRQLRRIIRLQALTLSAAGIPLGLVIGWLVGGQLIPVITARLNGVVTVTSVSPWIFFIASLFALFTVLLSCRKPGRMAAKVSPVEAVRYTEGGSMKNRAGERKARKATPLTMAWANLGRSRGKTAVTVLSLSLAVVLLNVTVNFAGGFDMDKYVANFTASDFIVANAGKFQSGIPGFDDDMGVPQQAMDDIAERGDITDSGVVYGQTSQVLEYITEEWFRQMNRYFYTPEQLDNQLRLTDRNETGDLAAEVQLSGMSSFALEHLTVLEGDLSALYEPGSRSIAAVYAEDDYGNANRDSHWAQLGDKVTLRYVEESELCNPDTGEVYRTYEEIPDGASWVERPVKYRDIVYTVDALVTVPMALSYRYYGADEFILNDRTFVLDTGTDSVMYYAFDTADETNAAMETFLADYTETVNPELDYESKALYAGEFESMRSMFLLLGGALSFIVGLVGVLNFFNAILTGIIARQKELAVLQAVGMTGRQLRSMLIWEGLLYALGAAGFALLLTLVLGPAAFRAAEGLFWFFTYRLDLTPFLLILPVFVLLGAGIPVLTGRAARKRTVVERLRME
ncbi:MAG: ABC transporter permease [Eubacteriales bacterium]|nr:ABC transporter permease [Eubacteriales bacterium]